MSSSCNRICTYKFEEKANASRLLEVSRKEGKREQRFRTEGAEKTEGTEAMRSPVALLTLFALCEIVFYAKGQRSEGEKGGRKRCWLLVGRKNRSLLRSG
jgi:hypothetical protein